ncbi:MAG TPA: HAD family hydrolase [Oligoflexia bacterium]|nr:HAD family hydrolase [Oligoflexia bacterium]
MQNEARKKLDHLVETTKAPVAIFDLDGTVFDVTYRTMEIVKRFAATPRWREQYADFIPALEKLRYQDFGYNIETTLNNVGIGKYSERAAHFVHEVETYWFRHFFTDELVLADVAYQGARECVVHLKKLGVHIVYLSGRDIPNMSRGTIESLEKFGFPIKGHGVTLCLKPAYGQDDLLFKKQSIETIGREGTVIATFDNEPANVDMFIKAFPDAVHFHFLSHYARHMELAGPHFYAISSFGEIGF